MLRFNSEEERLAHPQASLIPRDYFDGFFREYESEEIYSPDKILPSVDFTESAALMQAPLNEVLSPEKIASFNRECDESDDRSRKYRYFLCVACSHPEIPIKDLLNLLKSLDIEDDKMDLITVRKDFLMECLVEYFHKDSDLSLEDRVGDETLDLIEIYNVALITRNLDVLKKIHELAPDEMSYVRDTHISNFIELIENEEFEIIDWLIRHNLKFFKEACKVENIADYIGSPEAVAEVSRLLEKYMREKINTYHEEKSASTGQFDILVDKEKENEKEKEYALTILKVLVQRNDTKSVNDIKMLLDIPRVRQTLFHQHIQDNIMELRRAAAAHPDSIILDVLPKPVDEIIRLINEGKRNITFVGFGLGTNEITAIASALEKNKDNGIESINFYGNNLNNPDVVLLSSALSKIPTLKSLYLSHNNFDFNYFAPSAQAVAAFENLLENNVRLTLDFQGIDTGKECETIRKYLKRNELHANMDRLSEKLNVSLNFQGNISDYPKYSEKNKYKDFTPYFNLNALYNEIIQSKKDIQAFVSEHRLAKRHHDTLNDHWLSQLVLFHLRAKDIYHYDASIDNIDRRVLAARKCLASIKDKDSLYYKEACHEIGSYYAECASKANTEEDKKAFIKTALNFWGSCLYDREFMASPAGNGFEMRFAIQVTELLPNFYIPSLPEGERLISDKTLIAIDQTVIAKARAPRDISLDNFNADASLQETVKMAATDSFVLLLDKFISHHPDSRHVNPSTFFAMPSVVSEKVAYSQALNMLKELAENKRADKKADKAELVEKISVLSKYKKFDESFNQYIHSGQAELLVGKKPASLSEFVGLLYDKQAPEQSFIKSNIKKWFG